MKKKTYLMIAVLIILVAVFIFPKDCGYGIGGLIPSDVTLYNEECNCLGVKYSINGGRFGFTRCIDCGPSYYCIGFPIRNKCYRNEIRDGKVIEQQEIKCENIDSNDFQIKNSSFKIKLNNREFIPEPGLDLALKNKLNEIEDKNLHVYVQFYNNPSKSEKDRLSQKNISILDYIDGNAWIGNIPADNLEVISKDMPESIRWVGEIKTEDKIEPGLLEKGPGKWAENSDGTYKVKIIFYEDVSDEDLLSAINNHEGRVEYEFKTSSSYYISLSSDKIGNLAEEDSVEYISFYPPPPTID